MTTGTTTHAQRDHLLDVLRLAAAAIVILMHWMSTRTFMQQGAMTTELALHGKFVWALSWIIQSMPVLFIVGGAANAIVLQRSATVHAGDFIRQRVRKLLTPTILLGLVGTAVAVIAGLISPSVGGIVGRNLTKPLWFLVIYLFCIALAPWAFRAQRALGLWAVAIAMGVVIASDVVRLVFDQPWLLWVNLFTTWFACHQMGLAYGLRQTRRIPTWLLLAVAAIGAIVIRLMTTYLPYPPTMLGVRDAVESNLLLPTVCVPLLGVVQWLVITAISRGLRGDWVPPKASKILQIANPLMMVVYLWHVPVMIAASGLGLAFPKYLMPADEATWWWQRPLWIAFYALLLVPILRGAIAWEKLMHRPDQRVANWRLVIGCALAVTATFWMWRNGLGVSVHQIMPVVGTVMSLFIMGFPLRRTPSTTQPPSRQ